MADDWLDADPGETVEWSASPRTTRALSAVAVSGLLLAGVAWGALRIDPLVALGAVVAPIPAAYGYLRVVTTRFVVTDRAVYRKRGIVGIGVRTIELDRIQNTASSQGALGTLFGHGTVTVEVAGGPDLRLSDVHDPGDVRRLVERLAGTRREVPGALDQWRTIRAELRAIRAALDAGSGDA